MGQETKIEWCDHTFNPWRGCTKVSAGCAHCYADAQSVRNPAVLGIWGPNGKRVVASEAMWCEPIKWDKTAKAAGDRRRVFCASLADVFEDWTGRMRQSNGCPLQKSILPGEHWFGNIEQFGPKDGSGVTMSDVRARLFDLIDQTPNLDWLLLTKRPENIAKMMPRETPRPNVWLGVSVEDQATADQRIPHLLRVLAAVRFLSIEPLLGPIDLSRAIGGTRWIGGQRGCGGMHHGIGTPECPRELHHHHDERCATGLDWVIVGGESGPHARPMDPVWARSIRDQCRSAGVPFFFKQAGGRWRDKGGNLLDGEVIQQWPAAR